MMHRRVIRRFLDWSDNRIDPKERADIQRHLDDCDDCRRYFESMTSLMKGVGSTALPHLEPDPFLPARIRANVAPEPGRGLAQGAPASLRPVFGRLAVTMLGAGIVAAAVAGTLIGSGLSSRATAAQETRAIVDAYSEAFSQDEFATEWQTVLEVAQEDDS
jgi:anti-sigma factor RsiW